MIDSAIYTEQGQVKVYASPRPFGTSTYFSGAGDSATEIGAGNRLLFRMDSTDVSKSVDISYNSNVYIKDGYIITDSAPLGAYLDVEIVHPVHGVVGTFCKKVPIFSSFPIPLDTEDRSLLPAGMIVRVTVYNATGAGSFLGVFSTASSSLPQDPPTAFKVAGRIEVYR